MRDFWTASHRPEDIETAIQDGETVTIAAGDMANSYVGTKFTDPEVAERRGLDDDYEFGIGIIGSHVLESELTVDPELSGTELVAAANVALRAKYQELGLVTPETGIDAVDPTHFAIGYFAHAKIEPEGVTMTGVGDVLGWADGEQRVGINEKVIDTEKGRIISTVAGLDDQELATAAFEDFCADHGLNPESEYARTVFGNLSEIVWPTVDTPGEDFRQRIHQAMSRPLTLWQIREMQNQAPDPDSPIRPEMYYGAIDGTETPVEHIDTAEIPRDGRALSIVLATDGLRPQHTGRKVLDLSALTPTNTRYGEQTGVHLQIP
jgi:hypothetical protein